ncbi:hypothetical protein ACLB2K_036830 [Fragaria x ananassa]
MHKFEIERGFNPEQSVVHDFEIEGVYEIDEWDDEGGNQTALPSEIRNSVKLKRVMQTILSLGNALNQGTTQGPSQLRACIKDTIAGWTNCSATALFSLPRTIVDKISFFFVALHELDPEIKKFSYSKEVSRLLSSLAYKRPIPLQSMYIFKV